MFPTPITQLARSNPFQAPLFSIKPDQQQESLQIKRKLAAAAYDGLWKGLFARIIMIGTLTALQWFIYDSVKVYFRLPRPPPPEMPESLKRKMGLLDY